MDDYALVLNAGSSSLKFCVYRRPEGEAWQLEARGQIEGIGTSPRFSAKDGAGASLADEPLDAAVRDGRAALDALAAWLRARYGGARVLGVGHRVVHGGAAFAGPTIVTPRGPGGSAGAGAARAAPSAVQPRRPSKRCPSGCPACRRSPASTPASIAASRRSPSWCRCRATIRRAGVQRYGFHGLSYEYIASVAARRWRRRSPHGRVIVAHLGSGASLCAMKNGARASTARSASPRSTASAWARGRARSIPA